MSGAPGPSSDQAGSLLGKEQGAARHCWLIGQDTGKTAGGMRVVEFLATIHHAQEMVAVNIARFILANTALDKIFVTKVTGKCDHTPQVATEHIWIAKNLPDRN